MPQFKANPGILVATLVSLCAVPVVFAQIRLQEFPDSLTNDLQQQVRTLQQHVNALQQQVQQQAQAIGMLQPQVQNLSQETDMLGVLIQNEKVNTANMVSMLESQLGQMPSQWGQAINQRVAPLEQVLQISPSGVVVRSSGSLSLESPGTITLSGTTLNANVSTARFQLVLQTETLIANMVVGTSYTPGAGNIW